MKKYIAIIFFTFISIASFGQDSIRVLAGFDATGRPGEKIPDTIHSLLLASPLYKINPWTIGMDTSHMTFTVSKNGTDDSTIFLFNDGVRIAIYDRGGGGGAGWELAGNTATAGSDYIGTNNNISFRMRTNGIEGAVLDSNQRLGIGIVQPLAKFHLVNSGMGVTQTTLAGFRLENQTAASTGAQQISPFLEYTGRGWRGDFNHSSSFRTYNLPVQGNPVGGSLITQYSTNNGAYTNVMTLSSAGALSVTGNIVQTGVTGIFAYNYLTAPIALNGTSAISRSIWFQGSPAHAAIGQNVTTGNLDFRVNNPGSFALGNSAQMIENTSGSILFNTTTSDNSARVKIEDTTRGFLPPRMTTAHRDSMNLTVTGYTIVDGGTGYTTTPLLTFTNSTYGEIRAFAAATRTGTVITGVTITASGSYHQTPTITITGGGGSGAIITPIMTQVLTKGLMIYNTTVDKLQCWNGTSWNDLF